MNESIQRLINGIDSPNGIDLIGDLMFYNFMDFRYLVRNLI